MTVSNSQSLWALRELVWPLCWWVWWVDWSRCWCIS